MRCIYMTNKTVTSERTVLGNIPYPWNIVSLKDVCTKINDGVHKTPRYVEAGIPFISVNNMSGGKLDFADSKYISYDEHKELIKRCHPQREDILLSKVGTLGVVEIVNVDLEFSIFVQLALLKPNKDKILPLYLKYILNSSELQKAIQNNASGTTLRYIGIDKISNLTIPLPPLFEQQKIADILSKLDGLIQKIDQIIEQIQRLKKGLMQKLLTKGKGHAEFKHIVLGLNFLKVSIPDNWIVSNLEQIAEIIDTPHYTSPYFKSGVPVIRTTDCEQNGEIDYSKTKFTSEIEYEKRRKVIDPDVGDILYTREAPPGIAVIVNRKKISVGQRIVLLKPKQDVIKGKYLVSFLNSSLGTLQSNSKILKTTVEHVNIEDIRRFRIAIPSLQEQSILLNIFGNMNTKVSNLKNYNSCLLELKKGLMQKLLTGKLRVKV